MTLMQIEECFSNILKEHDWITRIPMGPRRFLGLLKEEISANLVFRRHSLDSLLISNFPIAIRNELLSIPIIITMEHDFYKRHVPKISLYDGFEIVKEHLLSVSPLAINFPFLVIGISDEEHSFEVLEIPSLFEGEQNVEVIDRSIEFPPEYYQAGLGILAYFNKILNEKYPNTPAKVKIIQENMSVKMIIETETGNREIIEQALEEYQQIIKGDISPEQYLQSQAHILELKTELRIMKVRLETQSDIIQFQKDQLAVLSDIISKGFNSIQHSQNQQPISIHVSPSIQIDNKLNQKQVFENNFADMLGVLNELKESLHRVGENIEDIDEVQAQMKESSTEQQKIGLLGKIKSIIDKAKLVDEGIGKSISLINDGNDLLDSLATHYNSVASLFGLPLA
ncbi:hypothetical protein [Paenibacillus taichungensis]|uniref:hypothetical protein n=2 Tax=Paenibacillus TaxID=44249 RepID=UPI00118091DC|nr:hypothetical protein [Paenibacillus taichungensis]